MTLWGQKAIQIWEPRVVYVWFDKTSLWQRRHLFHSTQKFFNLFLCRNLSIWICSLFSFCFIRFWLSAIYERNYIINIDLMEFNTFDLVFSLTKNVGVIHLSLLLLGRLFANRRNAFGTYMAVLWVFLAISMAFENIFEFPTNIFDLLLDLDDLGDAFIFLVLIELSVMWNDDFNVMFIYDFFLKQFKMPDTHVLLQITLYFDHLAPLLN